MDAFYASVELLRYPELQGQPVVIGGARRFAPDVLTGTPRPLATLREYAGRGVVTTATYEARAFGIHSGMGLMKAAALCPRAILLPADFDEYRRCSGLFKAAVSKVAPTIEDRGIDELYVDLTEVPGADEEGGARVARRLKDAVREATRLTCSIGIAPNKLLAKIASELDKPDGLTVLDGADLVARVWPLPARRINGIGPRAATRLDGLGIRTVGELAAADPEMLVAEFGASYGGWLHDAANGRDDRPVVVHREPKSMSRETTFERDLHPRRDRTRLSDIFTRLCAQVADDLKHKGYAGRNIGIKLRYDDFRTVTRDCTIDTATDDAALIRSAAGTCLRRVALDRRLRLLGVRVAALVPASEVRRQPAAAESGASYELPLLG